MKAIHTRTGARRSGDDYQDIIALEVMTEMLVHPDRYQWLQVEADDFGALDDIVALRTEGSYEVKQVKFSVEPEDDPVDWEYLLAQRKGTNNSEIPSLLQKWFSAYEKIRLGNTLHQASLVTNRIASMQIQNLLSSDGILDFEKSKDKDIIERINKQLGGDENKIKYFFDNFHFCLDKSGLIEYEETVKRRFYSLGGKSEGWLSLKDALRSWIRIKNEPQPKGLITLDHIKRAAMWNQLEQMPQNFEIPNDYILPDREFYKKFKKEIISGNQNCFVLNASPGVGKSTFLSYLWQELNRENVPVIRHHYFLSLSDRTLGRLEHEKIAASLMSEIMHNYQEALVGLSENNPDPADFCKWVTTAGRFFKKQSKRLVIIIDGLDHVWREQQSSENLNRLFEHFLPPLEGIVVVVGTQPVDDKYLPSRLSQFAPREQWIRLPLLDINAVQEWLKFHEVELNMPLKDYDRDRLSQAFFNKSNGHPLHLKYTLRTLLERDMLITEENINNLPGCSHNDIINYYEELWKNLSEQSRQILHLFALTNFPWPPFGLSDCIDPDNRNLAQVSTDLKQVKHLVSYGHLGLQLFHASLAEFVKNHVDHQMYADGLKRIVLNWLQMKAPPYWKWAYEWQILSEMGNQDQVINGLTRNWCIENITKRYSSREANQLFRIGIKSALSLGKIVELVKIGLLRWYYDNVYGYRDTVVHELLFSQLILKEDQYLTNRLFDNLAFLSETEIVQLAEYEKTKDNKDILNKCFIELNSRLKKPQDKRTYSAGDWDLRIGAMNKTAALATEEINVQRFFKYLCRNREDERSIDICETYVKELWLSNNSRILRELLQKDLTTSEHQIAIKYAVFLGFQEKIDLKRDVLNPKSSASPYAAIYYYLKFRDKFDFNANWAYPPNLFKLAEHEHYGNRKKVKNAFHNVFFTFIANDLSNKVTLNNDFIRNLDAHPWVKEFFQKLNKIAFELSNIFIEGRKIKYRWLYKQFEGFKKPNWPDDRDFSDYGLAAERALYQISFDLMIMGLCDRITKEDLITVFDSSFCYLWSWVDAYVDRQKCYMNDDCCAWFFEEQAKEIKNVIEQFNERASHFAKLAYIAANHRKYDKAKEFVSNTAENLLTHGEHKDMILFHILDIIQECHKCGISNTEDWLLKIIPVVACVTDFTDGDETHDLPIEIAKVMSEIMPEYLPKYYIYLCNKEDYFKALSVFHIFLRTADLSKKINQALARTAIDDKSIEILSERLRNGEQNAQGILEDISNYLGGLVPTKSSESEDITATGLHSEKSYPNPSDFPPEDLLKYFEAANVFTPYDRGTCLKPWLEYWGETDRKEDAFKEIVKEEERGHCFGLENYDMLYKLALSLYGKTEAYPWLVKAHIERGGWSHYYSSEAEAVGRWQIIKQDYPGKWLDFIRDTMKSKYGNELDLSMHENIVRLVKYSIFMDQTDLAKEISEQVITSLLEFVSPINFEKPEWLDTK